MPFATSTGLFKGIAPSALTSLGDGHWIGYLNNAVAGDGFSGVGLDATGNVYAFSSSTYPQVAKFTSAGSLTFSDKGLGVGFSLRPGGAVDSSGNSYVAFGALDSSINVVVVMKYNASGVLQWQRKIAPPAGGGGGVWATGMPHSVALDSTGANVHIVMEYTPDSASNSRFLIVKYNSSGTLQWQRAFGGTTANEIPTTLFVDSSGNVYAGGNTYSGSRTSIVVKYNSSGTLQWQRAWDTAGGCYTVAVDSSGNVYAGGEGHFLKFDSTGTLQWQRRLWFPISVYTYSTVIEPITGYIYTAGYSRWTSTGKASAHIVKLDSSGNQVWVRRLGGTGNGTGAWAITSDGSNYYIAGYTPTTKNALRNHHLLAKLPADGSKTGTYVLASEYFDYTIYSEPFTVGGITTETSTVVSATSSAVSSTPAFSEYSTASTWTVLT